MNHYWKPIRGTKQLQDDAPGSLVRFTMPGPDCTITYQFHCEAVIENGSDYLLMSTGVTGQKYRAASATKIEVQDSFDWDGNEWEWIL